jgi:hypothetical protein
MYCCQYWDSSASESKVSVNGLSCTVPSIFISLFGLRLQITGVAHKVLQPSSAQHIASAAQRL